MGKLSGFTGNGEGVTMLTGASGVSDGVGSTYTCGKEVGVGVASSVVVPSTWDI